MALEEPSQKEAEEARRYLEELRKDPEKYNKWLDTVLDKALKGWRSKKTRKPRTKKTRRS
jgi:transposase